MKRSSLLFGATLSVALLLLYLVLLQSRGQAELPDSTATSGTSLRNQEILPDPSSEPVRAALPPSVDISPGEASTSMGTNLPKRIAFADLPLGVRDLMAEAAEKLNLPLATVTAGGVDAGLAGEFAILVHKLDEQYQSAVAVLDTEVRQVKVAYIAAGKYKQFSDEAEFRAALKFKEAEGICRIEVEGAQDGPNGKVPVFRIITVDIEKEPGLKAAQDTLNGLAEYRSSLRDRSVSLFSR